MDESVFWELLAKHISGNTTPEEKAYIDTVTALNGNRMSRRDTSTIFGKSKKDIKSAFEKLERKLDK